MQAQPSFTLNSGDKMPAVGFGTWQIPNDKTANAVYTAIKNGYRLIDEASMYANELEAGQGIAQAIKEGIVTRQDLFITSKLWSSYHAKEHVEKACRRSL